MKVYLEMGPMHDMEVPICTLDQSILTYEYGLWCYGRTGRTHAGLRVYVYLP